MVLLRWLFQQFLFWPCVKWKPRFYLCLCGLGLSVAMTLPITLYGQRRPYNLPKEPIEFAKTPHRSNALDLQVGVQGRFFSLAFRYQRAPNPQFSFMVDASFYFHVIDPLNIIIAQAGSEQWDLNRDLRIGGGGWLSFLALGKITQRIYCHTQPSAISIFNCYLATRR